MMTVRKNVFCIILISVLCLLFCACDHTEDVTYTTETDSDGNVITMAAEHTDPVSEPRQILFDRDDPDAEYITTAKAYEILPTERTIDPLWCRYVDGAYFYVMLGSYPNPEFCCFDRDGKQVWSRPVPDREDGAAMYAVVLPNDNMIVVYRYHNNPAEGFFILYDADGNILLQNEVPKDCRVNSSCFRAKVLAREDGGYRVVMLFVTAMLVIDENLQVETVIPINSTMNNMTHRGGDIFWIGYDTYLYEVDIGARTVIPLESHPYHLDDLKDGDLCFDGAGNVYYVNDIGVYALGEDGGREIVLEWLNGCATKDLCQILDSERIYTLQPKLLTMDSNVYQLLDASHTAKFTKPRRVIEIGLLLTGDDMLIKEAVSLFNAENEDYFVRLIDYNTYGSKAVSVFREQVFAGDTPDMLISAPDMLKRIAFDNYTSKNLVLDLAPIYGNSLLGAVRYAMTEGEHMWSLPISMTVSTYAAARSVSDGPLTLDAFYQMADKLSGHGGMDEVYPTNGGVTYVTDANGNTVVQIGLATPETEFPFEGEVITSDHKTIQAIFENGLYEFVDYENKDASFDSAEFSRFIEYLKRVDEDYVHINAGGLTSTYINFKYQINNSYLRENLLEGKLQLLPVTFQNIGLYPALKRLYGDGEVPFVLCGYPSSEGCGAKISTDLLVTVMADSTAHGGCQAFLDFLLSDRVQTSDKLIGSALPVTLTGLSGAIDRYRYFYYIREGSSGLEPVAVSDVPLEKYSPKLLETYYIEIAITDEDKAAMMDFFENCHMRADSDPVITSIVKEELSFWNGGARTLEESANIIQSRVWIYLNE